MKHIKFDESPIMRSFERVAKERKLLKEEPPKIKKEASKKDVKELSFDEKILGLANLLRSQGFAEYANSLENKFASYKKASVATLYHQADDGLIECPLLDEAHSEGSVEICPTKSHEGVVETLQDRQKKIKEIALKEPKKSSLNLNPKYKSAKISQVMIALGIASHLKSVNDAFGLIMNAYYGPFNVYNKTQFAAYVPAGDKFSWTGSDPEWISIFKVMKALKESGLKEKLDEKVNLLRGIFSKSEYNPDGGAAAKKAINEIISDCIGAAYQAFLTKSFNKNDIYNATNLDAKKAGYDWWNDLKKAQGILENLRSQIGSKEISKDESTPEGYWHPGDFKSACFAAYKPVSTLTFSNPERADERGEFLEDLENLSSYFSKGYLSNDAVSNGESLNGKINLSKLPQIISNLGSKTIRDNSAAIGVDINTVTSFDAFKNLLGRWVGYFKKNV